MTRMRDRRRSLIRFAYRRMEGSGASRLVFSRPVQRVRGQLAVKISAHEVVEIIATLQAAGVHAWLGGGWGVDALLGRQTRKHSDVDLILDAPDESRAVEALACLGFSVQGRSTITNQWTPARVVLRDRAWRLVDLHPVDLSGLDLESVFEWLADDSEGGLTVPDTPFAAGSVAGRPVGCLSVEMQLVSHRGYELRGRDRNDVAMLKRRLRSLQPVG